MALRFPRINRTWLMLGGAIVLGLAATGLTTFYLKQREQSIQAELEAKTQRGPDQEVVVATRDLPAGVVIDGSMVASRPIPADLVGRDYIIPDGWDRFDGARILTPLQAGVPLRMSDLQEKGANVSDLLEEGQRAITIDIDDPNSIAQMVKPGNTVDLFLIMPDMADPAAASQQIVLFMQRLKVFATGQRVSAKDEGHLGEEGAGHYGTVTLEVSPEQAARIALAQQLGKFRVALRKEDEHDDIALGRINSRNLLKKSAISDAPEDFDQSSIEFIIGGGNSNGIGNTVNVNVPGLAPPGGGVPAAGPGGVAVPSVPAQYQSFLPAMPAPPAAR